MSIVKYQVLETNENVVVLQYYMQDVCTRLI